MKRILPAVMIPVLAIIFAMGCGHIVSMKGVINPGVERQIPMNTALHVNVEQGPDSEDEDEYDREEIERKLTILLVEKGYRITPASDAVYILHCTYETIPLVEKRMLEMISGPRAGVHTIRREGPFDHKLSLWMVENAPLAEREDAGAVWAGAAVIHGQQSASPRFLDLLLIAAIRHFPDDTDGTVEINLNLESQEAKRLRR